MSNGFSWRELAAGASSAADVLRRIKGASLYMAIFGGHLSRRQAALLHEVIAAILDGKAKLGGKRQNSFRQYWRADYSRKQRMLSRICSANPGLSEFLRALSRQAHLLRTEGHLDNNSVPGQ